jgi:hypothetical protein
MASSRLVLTAFAIIGPMDSIKLGLITVCCIISVKLTDWHRFIRKRFRISSTIWEKKLSSLP